MQRVATERSSAAARGALVATIAIAALGLAHDPPAAAINAGCLERPTKARAKRTHGAPSPPLAIGDSVMIYSVPLLGRAGLDADARPCRSWVDADRMIRGRAKGGTLPEVVVVALGANGPFTVADIVRVVRVMGPQRILALLTARWSGDRPGYGVDAIHAAHRRYPKRVQVLDWVTLSTGHPGWFAADGVHLGSKAGIRAYTKLIESADARDRRPPHEPSARQRRLGHDVVALADGLRDRRHAAARGDDREGAIELAAVRLDPREHLVRIAAGLFDGRLHDHEVTLRRPDERGGVDACEQRADRVVGHAARG
jgi:hypothetical protein